LIVILKLIIRKEKKIAEVLEVQNQ